MSARHKRRALRGLHPTLPGEPAVFHASDLEADAITLALFQPAPPLVRRPETIWYRGADGRRRRYTPDLLLLERRRGPGRLRGRLLEAKYRDELRMDWDTWRARYVAARDWAAARGLGFELRTESSLRTPRLGNARDFLPARFWKVRPKAVDALLGALDAAGDCTARELVDRALRVCPHEGDLMSALWRLIAEFRIAFDADRAFSLDARIWPGPVRTGGRRRS